MPLQREYFPSDTIKLINASESQVVRSGARSSTIAAGVDDRFGAHSIGRHLLKGAPGSLGEGVPFNEFKDRFLSSPEMMSSAWAGKGEMATCLCELLNSTIGQFALGQLDRGVHRIVVHYLKEGTLDGLFGGLAGAAKFDQSRVQVRPASIQKEQVTVMAKGVAKTFEKKVQVPRQVTASVARTQIVSVNAVLDRFVGGLHLQTLFPSSDATQSYAEWRISTISMRADLSHSGTIQI
jgi:hypothetical protein